MPVMWEGFATRASCQTPYDRFPWSELVEQQGCHRGSWECVGLGRPFFCRHIEFFSIVGGGFCGICDCAGLFHCFRFHNFAYRFGQF